MTFQFLSIPRNSNIFPEKTLQQPNQNQQNEKLKQKKTMKGSFSATEIIPASVLQYFSSSSSVRILISGWYHIGNPDKTNCHRSPQFSFLEQLFLFPCVFLEISCLAKTPKLSYLLSPIVTYQQLY